MERLLKVGDITLDMRMFTASRKDRHINLTPGEFKLLSYLMLNSERVVSKEEIVRNLWNREITTNNVEVYIRYLRKKLGNDSIETRHGFGYVIGPQ